MDKVRVKRRTIVEIGYLPEMYGPVKALRDYFIRDNNSFYFVAHSPKGGSQDYSTIYFNGNLVKKIPKLKNEYIQYIKELFISLLFLFKIKGEINLYVGMNNFYTLPAILIRGLKKIHKVIFYTADYIEKKFNNYLLNKIYHLLDLICIKYSDYVFSSTERTSEIRIKQGIKKEKNIVVRNGVYINRIPPLSTRKNANKKLYFVGFLTKAHGIQDAILIISEVIDIVPDIQLYIIGSGPYKSELKKLVAEKKLFRNIFFLEGLRNKEVLELLSSGGIGLAPYNLLEGSWVKYCDPVKVKEYLACGCPVIISSIPEIADEVVINKAGFKYYTHEELRNAILCLVKDKNKYLEFRENAIKLGQRYDWNKIYDEAFRF